MKKKLLSITALALGTLLLVSCSNVSQKLQFEDNWSKSVLDGITSGTETLTYDVSFDNGSSLHEEYYEVEYCKDENGKEQKGEYVTNFVVVNGTFTYTTTLTLPVLYTFNGETRRFQDEVTTEIVFESAAKSLRPVRSLKKVKCTTPRDIDAEKWEQCYREYDYEIETTYEEDLSSGSIVWTDYKGTVLEKGENETSVTSDPSTFDIDTSKYTYLDNEQILFAIRGIPSSTLNATKTVTSYDASWRRVRTVEIAPSSAESERFSFTLNGNALADTVIDYIPVSLSYSDGLGGLPQELWYAKTTNTTDNTYRNVLLYMKVSAPYAIGDLAYKLTSATFA